MSLYEAWIGAKVELAAIHSPVGKLRRLAGISSTFAQEIWGQFGVIPYAIRALRTYHSQPQLQWAERQRRHNATSLIKGVRYGAGQRNVMDIYLPAASDSLLANDEQTHKGAPVALFCHGGVWATGASWHYAPMASRLAGAGVLCCVMHYTLYPDALVPQMAEEVSSALSWALDNVASVGGDPERVSLMGHSAGAQLCAMALLHRAKSSAWQRDGKCGHADGRMPKRFIGMAGVYDLAKHFRFESRRGVQELSTMKRAAGGERRFPSVSPVVILAQTLQKQRGSPHKADAAPSGPALRGEAIAHRIGFERPAASLSATLAALAAPAEPPDLQLTADEARRLPPTVLLSSCVDKIVPWYESAEMFWMLHDCGVKVKHLVYNFAGHGDFVVSWKGRSRQAAARTKVDTGDDLSDVARDVLALVTEQVEPKYV